MSSVTVVTVCEVVVSVTAASPVDASAVSVVVSTFGSFTTEHIRICDIDVTASPETLTFLNT